MYSEFLKDEYKKNPDLDSYSYNDQLEYLIYNTSDIVGAQVRTFRKLGIEASCIIDNANFLQEKWKNENDSKDIDKHQALIKQIKKYKPNVLVLYHKKYYAQTWISDIRHSVPQIKIVVGNFCAPYFSHNIPDFRNLDVLLTCTPGLNAEFNRQGIRSFLVYHAFDTSVLKRITTNEKEKKDFIFSGSLLLGGKYHTERVKYIEGFIEEEIDIKIYANLEQSRKIFIKNLLNRGFSIAKKARLDKIFNKIPIYNSYYEYFKNSDSKYSKLLLQNAKPPVFGFQMYELIARSKMVFNNHGSVAGNFAGNVRLFEATGLGSCLLTDNKENMGDLFEDGKEIVLYDSIDDCIEKVKWLLLNDSERMKIAEAGRKRTIRDHTVEQRCLRLLEIFSNELKRKNCTL
jgi:spore maturation protein CgeB